MDQQDKIFKELFAAEYSRLCRYALTFLHDSHQAEDVVQETFVKIWETKRDLLASTDIRYYLITAVRNNCISALRKLKTAGVQYTEAAPEPEPEPFFTALQQRQDASEQARRVAAALDMLPPKCREVFLLIKLNGLSYQQAADSLSISVKTVENQMGKALKTLRERPVAIFWILIVPGLAVAGSGGVGVLIRSHVLT